MDKHSAMANKLLQPNPHATGVMKLLNEYYPSFAKKVLYRNPVMKGMAMFGMCSMDILMYPICGIAKHWRRTATTHTTRTAV